MGKLSGSIWEFPGKDTGLNSESLAIQGEAEEVMLHWLQLVQNVSLIFVFSEAHQACDIGPSMLTQHIPVYCIPMDSG